MNFHRDLFTSFLRSLRYRKRLDGTSGISSGLMVVSVTSGWATWSAASLASPLSPLAAFLSFLALDDFFSFSFVVVVVVFFFFFFFLSLSASSSELVESLLVSVDELLSSELGSLRCFLAFASAPVGLGPCSTPS